MLLQTKYFGRLNVEDSDIYGFRRGLLGFEDVNRFILIDNEEEGSPFKWLQGLDGPKPAFVIIDPFAVRKDYEIKLNDELLKELDIKDPSDVVIYCIVVVPEDINNMTVNLQAPLIINIRENRGRQVVLDTDMYGVRHYILEELHGREDRENAGADKKKGSVHNSK